MSFEVEQKFRTDGHAGVSARLDALGATRSAPSSQEDAYLSHPSRNFATTGEALRLRRVGDWNAVTYKGPRRPGPTKTREEIEVAFDPGPVSLSALRRVFEILGFLPVAVVHKVRTTYRLDSGGRAVEVVLDEVRGLGTFVEVEAIAADEADLAEAQRVVVALAESLGLTDPEPRSYLRMTLERGGAP